MKMKMKKIPPSETRRMDIFEYRQFSIVSQSVSQWQKRVAEEKTKGHAASTVHATSIPIIGSVMGIHRFHR